MSEILAPAGSEKSAIAAINAGADAIYLGLASFSARSSAENFDWESFKKICLTARGFGVKVYVALNTLVKDEELDGFLTSAVRAWNTGADALIVQDLFLGKFLKRTFPQTKLHLSTQAGTCNVYGAELAKEYGFDRVILARETKLEDIKKITEIIETEVFVQGALCTCFSGQCYMSSFAGGNSGNRGKCKQPCRKLYSIDRQGFEERAYRLSLSDLCVGENIADFIDAGVYSFKIEGRMRRPEYVAASVKYYRDIIGGDCGNLSLLKRTYNRGNYTKGLAFGQDKNFISSAVQGHIGEFVGVIKVQNAKYICQSDTKFSFGDGFKILRGGKETGGGAYGGQVKGGFILNSRDRLKNGDKAFITTDTALNEKLLSDKREITVKISAEFIAGNKAKVFLNGIEFNSENTLEEAQSHPLSIEEIKNCFEKVDGYPFKPAFGEVVADGVFIAKSELNALRRNAYAELWDKITASTYIRTECKYNLPQIKNAENDRTAVIAQNLNGVNADMGILKLNSFSEDIKRLFANFRGEKYLYVPPYATGDECKTYARLSKDFDGIYCDSYFGLKFAEICGKKFFAGAGFNVTNSVALSECDADCVCLSKEITVKEAYALSRENTFYLTAGNIKVMDLIYCPFEKKCSACDKLETYTLTDADKRKFPLRRYVTNECRFEVYNCADLAANVSVNGALYDLTLFNAAQIKDKIDCGEPLEEIFKNYTRGHSVNGIL